MAYPIKNYTAIEFKNVAATYVNPEQDRIYYYPNITDDVQYALTASIFDINDKKNALITLSSYPIKKGYRFLYLQEPNGTQSITESYNVNSSGIFNDNQGIKYYIMADNNFKDLAIGTTITWTISGITYTGITDTQYLDKGGKYIGTFIKNIVPNPIVLPDFGDVLYANSSVVDAYIYRLLIWDNNQVNLLDQNYDPQDYGVNQFYIALK